MTYIFLILQVWKSPEKSGKLMCNGLIQSTSSVTEAEVVDWITCKGTRFIIFFRRLPHACQRLPKRPKRLIKKEILEDYGLRDLTFRKHKRSWILLDWNDLFSRHRRVKFDSYVIN